MKGYLARRDPTAKVAVVLALTLALVLVIDPVTPLLFGAITVAAAMALGGVGPGRLVRASWPLALIALGFIWTNALFARPSADASVIAAWGPLRATDAGLLFGMGIGLRGLAIGLLSIVFVLTTDPTELIVSLIRHARLPFRIGYPFLAAYRFLPLFSEERAQIALAQRVRGARGPRALAQLLPLLASAVRRAARIAIAMDARGFSSARTRTYLRDPKITRADVVFAGAALAIAGALLGAGAVGGWLRLWDGRFSA